MLQSPTTFDAIFFSPHLDDAILSAGGMIKSYCDRSKRVLIVTLFTEGDDTTFSEDAVSFLKASHSPFQSKILFKKRKKEDVQAIKKLGAIEVQHFPFIDALFRKDLSGKAIYPSFQFLFSGKISKHDKQLLDQILKHIQKDILPHVNNTTQIYGPLGVGNHVDHVLTFELLRNIFNKIAFWQDVPYDTNYLKVLQRLSVLRKKKIRLRKKIEHIQKLSDDKRKAVDCYFSQVKGLKAAGLEPRHYFQEIYYSII